MLAAGFKLKGKTTVWKRTKPITSETKFLSFERTDGHTLWPIVAENKNGNTSAGHCKNKRHVSSKSFVHQSRKIDYTT